MKNALATALEPEGPAEELQQENSGDPPGNPPEQQQVEKDEGEGKEKFVPHGAFHEERERRKAAQKELEQERQQRAAEKAVLQDRLNQLFQASQQAKQEKPQFRDPNVDPDPLAAMTHNQQLTVQQMAELQKRLDSDAARQQHAEYEQRVVNWGAARAEEFRQTAPDFDEAYVHVRKNRAAELHAMGMPIEAIKQTLRENELWIIQSAAQTGRNPAELVYNMAKATGWKAGAKQIPAEQKMDTLQKGTQAAKNLGNGTADGGIPTPEQIAAMSDEDFSALKAKLAKQGKSISDIL